ncbi:transporter [Opitutaceae bacterium EW11]|nr:transporter [Opitutaceae bacterium EW11]
MARAEDTNTEESEDAESKERRSPSSKVVHDAVLAEGFEELERPTSALAWSGLAAGLSMGLSLIAEGTLRTYVPEANWAPLVTRLGYSVGFIVVILGRQQLFTENTLTPILPLLERKDRRTFFSVLRLWIIVLVTNLFGGMVVAFALAKTSAFDPDVREAFVKLGREALSPSAGLILLRGVLAGWIIALLVWLLPFAEVARLWVILILTYLIGLAKLSHVIAGSIEVFVLAACGHASWASVFSHYILPALAGNVLGGVALVAFVNHAQVAAGKDD